MMPYRPVRHCLALCAIAATPLPSLAFEFDWDILGWTNTFTNQYVAVGGSNIDVVVTVSDPLDRTNPASALHCSL